MIPDTFSGDTVEGNDVEHFQGYIRRVRLRYSSVGCKPVSADKFRSKLGKAFFLD